ncbi:hypothetical protein A9Q93_05125 [Nonlabens dokdonensis]|uniref:Uncharacterized protein n=1 Tax=Nonlabens dokdonensis TaxID=328515 RepID=A0A1Z8B3B2_9FLAO|nr:hypothetical protein [Nonlabens dokdonensis]OUS17064.1 hypothetical protein A9Q93_05125 [Nonlabens dokdonensis]
MLSITYYDLPYVELFVFPKYMIAQVKDGTVLAPENNDDLNKIAQKHFEGEDFVYISNRVFEYNVSPMTYIETSKISNLKGVAIVTNTDIGRKTASFESKFYTKDFMVVSTIEDAINWAVHVLEKYE